ncbi:ATP-dependent DNA helicase MER3 [Oleoguttula sp. CCFEE 5521]
MEQRIFDQLDRLQRGARNVGQIRQPTHYGSMSGGDHQDYGHNSTLAYTTENDGYEYGDENVDPEFHRPQFAYEGCEGDVSSSPTLHQPQPSSPAFRASQRHAGAEPPNLAFASTPGTSNFERVVPIPQSAPDRTLQHRLPRPRDINAYVLAERPIAQPRSAVPRPSSGKRQASSSLPVVQGITLVPTGDLPDRFRSIFPFPLFNAVQSKCFEVVYRSNDNFVLSSPTGSGKTAILELAICRLMNGFANGTYKIVYQAPTKSLCAERQRDWQAKFGPFDLQVAELTGDTDIAQLKNVQYASIIITTPEKWDSMTRKWKDHQRLMQMIKLFLIDEVHILKEDRGATLEAIVSRMKSVGSDIRFIALSATVPNSQDIATWLGKDPVTPHVPAPRERFGEEFRPVRLARHVCGYAGTGNDFVFDKVLNAKLPEVIAKWSQRKPVMVFCFTRASCVDTAKLLATWWDGKGPRDRYWEAPRSRLVIEDKDLRGTVSSGVSFHHAGLSIADRTAVEKGYLEGEINVICCTSTLAVGVNLPCHMVIIKNTVTYQRSGSGGCKEYSDLETMQMLGRAGRPQFDDSAVAVIMTRLHRVQHYEKMVTGQEILESCLHLNLIDHLNAEIGLGTITNAATARKWLSGTFLYVRLKDNPEHYRIDGDSSGRNLDQRLEDICTKAITLLEGHDLVNATPKLHCTEFGDAMARYYVQFETMKLLLELPRKAKVSEILSALAQAGEFKEVRFRAGEKTTYKDLNKNASIKFPIPIDLDASAHKVSLVIQSVLGAVDLPTEDPKQRAELQTSKSIIFLNVQRLVRCVIDCQLQLQDAVTARNALALARSLGAQVWDDSPLHMKQLDSVGLVYVRKLAAAGLKSIDDIENAEQHRLEVVLSRNPPFGAQLQEKARGFPKLRVSMKAIGEPIIKKGEHVTVRVRAEMAFLNEKTPEMFQRKPVYVCLLAELSDGHLVHFARISAKKLNKGQEVLFAANLTSPNQHIRAYVSCDGLAGTSRQADLRPEIPSHAFPPPKTAEEMNAQRAFVTHAPNIAKRRAEAPRRQSDNRDIDEFGDAGLEDADFVLAEVVDYANIDDYDDTVVPSKSAKGPAKSQRKTSNVASAAREWAPQQLENGKWACGHACKDKTACKHLCCREGLDKKPKPPKAKVSKQQPGSESDTGQRPLDLTVSKTTAKASLSCKKVKGPEVEKLNRLAESVKTQTRAVPLLGTGKSAPASKSTKPMSGQSRLSFTKAAREVNKEGVSSDYGGTDDLPSPSRFVNAALGVPDPATQVPELPDDEDDEMLDFGWGTGTPPGRTEDLPSDNIGADLYPGVEGDDFVFDADWAVGEPPELHMPPAMQPPARYTEFRSAINQPFQEASSDSAARDLGVRPAAGEKRDLPLEDTLTVQEFKKARLDLSSATACLITDGAPLEEGPFVLTEDSSDLMAGTPDIDHQQNHPAGSDDLLKWFEENIGMENFNYIG